LLQEGYVAGNLLAAAVAGVFGLFVMHAHPAGFAGSWRMLFVIGALPSVFALWMLSRVQESPVWLAGQRAKAAMRAAGAVALRSQVSGVLGSVGQYWRPFLYLTVLMFAFTSFSHGTQDLYPTFLEKNHAFGSRASGLITSVGSVGALLGGICFGTWSERLGRRKAIIIASLLAIPMIPLWAWSHTVVMISVGAFLMQFMVQGAWGVVPAHLNELSPGPVRGTFPGFAYQLGNLLSSRNSVVQARMAASRFGGSFRVVLSVTVFVVALLVAGIAFVGGEAKGADLRKV